MKLSPSTIMFAIAGLIVVGLIGFTVTKNAGPSQYDSLAQCLTDNGAKAYTAWWCPHCENLKAEFGSAWSTIDNTECSPNGSRTFSAFCTNEGIESVPSWKNAEGEIIQPGNIGQLAAAFGCEATLPQE